MNLKRARERWEFQWEERTDRSFLFSVTVLLIALVCGVLLIGVVFISLGVNPVFALKQIFLGSFGSLYGLKESLTKAIPLFLIAGGLCVAYKAKFWNIGAESQLLMGAVFSTWFGLNVGQSLPPSIGVPLLFLMGFLGGALWGIIPAILKVRFGISEVISTLMLNYIAAEFVTFLIVGPWKGATKHGFPYTDDLPKALILDTLPGSRIHYITLILGILLCMILFILLYRSKFGYEVRVVGESPEAARYAGIDFFKTSLLIMVISGGAAGLAGVGEVAGIHHHLGYPGNISAGYGFTAIITAWLGKLNPLLTLISGLFFAGILVGGDAIQISLRLPAATVNIFNGILLFVLIVSDYFLKHRLVIRFRQI
ncbi:MAG TPA: ABC transporter permease [Spirochaetales bacterium]|nr:ABC transporter permease [Spirochaetales bacterium]